jgi:hypothetical protein
MQRFLSTTYYDSIGSVDKAVAAVEDGMHFLMKEALFAVHCAHLVRLRVLCCHHLSEERSSQEGQHHGDLGLPVSHNKGGEEEEQEVLKGAAGACRADSETRQTCSIVGAGPSGR